MKTKPVLLLASSAGLSALFLLRPAGERAGSSEPPQSAPVFLSVSEAAPEEAAGEPSVMTARDREMGASPQAMPDTPGPSQGTPTQTPAVEATAPGYVPTAEEVETRMAILRRKLSERSAAEIRQRLATGDSTRLPVMPPPTPGEPAPLVVPYAIGTPSTPATLPAILATPESATDSEDATKTAVIEKMRDDFVAAVSVPDASPADPDYQERWQAAQEASDHLYRLRFGHDDWVRAQIRAHRQSLADSGTGDAAYQAKALRRDSGEQVP